MEIGIRWGLPDEKRGLAKKAHQNLDRANDYKEAHLEVLLNQHDYILLSGKSH